MENLIPDGEPETVGIGQRVKLRRLPLIQYPPDLIGEIGVVVDFDFSGDENRYIVELNTDSAKYRGRHIELRRHSFTTQFDE